MTKIAWISLLILSFDSYSVSFQQDVSTFYTEQQGLPSRHTINLIATKDHLYAVTKKGLTKTASSTDPLKWQSANNLPDKDQYADLFNIVNTQILPDDVIQDYLVLTQSNRIIVATKTGVFIFPGKKIYDGNVRQLAFNKNKKLYLATAKGLFKGTLTGHFKPINLMDKLGRNWTAADVRGVAIDEQENLWVATPAGLIFTDKEQKPTFYTGKNGLPYADFTKIKTHKTAVWMATHFGVIRFENNQWSYRQGRRWLPHDDVLDLVVFKGDIYVATSNGVGRITSKVMTLAEKAEYYSINIDRYHKRTTYGYVSPSRLKIRGNQASAYPVDSDNDGLWTAMYGVSQIFSYAHSGSKEAEKNAKQVFKAMKFLSDVTYGGTPTALKGFIARSVVPISSKNPNIGRKEKDIEKRKNKDSLWKIMEPRWPISKDKQWYWKSDTSSDELDGHFFFYPLYYDLIAHTATEKLAVKNIVRKIMNHLLQNDYQLIDYDGKVTRWGTYRPKTLNNEKYWWPERGLKSTSLLAYLAATYHITQDKIYLDKFKELVSKEYFATNAMVAKIQWGIGSGNQSDDEMAFMSFYTLLKYLPVKDLNQKLSFSFYSYWTLVQPEMNPFFNYTYAASFNNSLNKKYQLPWGEVNLEPWPEWKEDALFTLKKFPLNMINYKHHNSHRLDVVFLPRQQESWPGQEWPPKKSRRGVRVNGKVIPIDERHLYHWNVDPFRLDTKGNGDRIADGTTFLIAYYMGLYYGFIDES